MYSWRGYFLALLLHLASIFVLYQVLRGISSSHCKPAVKGFCPYHFGKIWWVLFMIPCWLSFARFTFPVWSVASSGATQLHGCLVYTRHLNCLLLPPCTYGLILILLLLLLLPGFSRVGPSLFLGPLRMYLFWAPCLPSPVLLLQSLQFLSRSLSFLIACRASNTLPDLDYAPRFNGR